MIRGSLTDLARDLAGTLVGPDPGFAGVATDSRSLRPGELFVALRGPHFDGHDFLGAAAGRGAAAVVVERPLPCKLPRLRVASSLRALGAMASAWRARFELPVMAVTGSFGKTTAKEMLAAIAATRGAVLATHGNLNNEIGLPLTLFGLGAEHRVAVLELGANQAGEIARLTAIARPTVGLVTGAGPAHLEGFGTLEGVAHAKGELFAGLSADATAVINADDPFLPVWRDLAAGRRQVTFGMTADADFSAAQVAEGFQGGSPQVSFQLQTPDGAIDVRLAVAGRHNVVNALGAAAAAWAAGFDLPAIASGLADVRGVPGRLGVIPGPRGATIIDDSYNSNPAALRAAIDYAVSLPGEAWLVLGDMAELGPESDRFHAAAGRYAREQGVARLFAYGARAVAAAEAYRGGEYCEDLDALAERLGAELHAGVNLLVKGSRSMRLERLVQKLTQPEAR